MLHYLSFIYIELNIKFIKSQVKNTMTVIDRWISGKRRIISNFLMSKSVGLSGGLPVLG